MTALKTVKNDASNDTVALSAEESSKLKSIDETSAKEMFKKYADILVAEKRGSLAAFFADPLLKVADDTITITVGSKIVENQIIEDKIKLIRHFAAAGYRLSGLECVVNATEISEYKIFSPKEQFAVLAREYPALSDFASRFNLDFE
ncbi:MAG: hypothetical protein ACJA19_001960 [Bacteroidia bacterium]|jgi:hypothetical protein|tara:strand:+ start:513 stop:953 length:441 start_codon:yes stop_codon:yes gene_type:complete